MRATLLTCAVLLAATRLHAAPEPVCPAVDSTLMEQVPLPHLAAVVKPGGTAKPVTLNVLALGSATMFGPQTDAAADIRSSPRASDPGASDPGASDTGASDTGASDPGASNPGTSNIGTSKTGAAGLGASKPDASAPGALGGGAPKPALPRPALSKHAGGPGPASGATPGVTSGTTGFPWQMAQALQAAVKNLRVNVTFIGGHGVPADAMLAKLQAELSHRHYQLVIWQTGTVEAVSEAAPDDFYQSLSDGAAAVAAAGADLVLVNPQYSRFLEANANVAPYLSALQAAAALPGVTLFDRYGIMHDWVDDDALDLEHADAADRPALAASLHLCLGRALAAMLRGDAAGS